MKKKLIISGIILVLIIGSFISFKIYLNKDLNNTKWLLTGWSSTEISPDLTEITINFSNHQISGNGGVNSYSGDYIVKTNHKLIFGDISSTEMASMDENINKAETLYFSLLQKVEYYELDNNILSLLDKNNNVLLMYNKK